MERSSTWDWAALPTTLVEEGLGGELLSATAVLPRQRLAGRALGLVGDGEKVLLVARSAWEVWEKAAREAWMRGDNLFLLEALDPREAELAGVSLSKMAVARLAYLARRPAEKARMVEAGVREKRVTRRALFASGIAGSTFEYVEDPAPSELCAKHFRGLCSRCMDACGGCVASAALCPGDLLEVPSFSTEALWEHITLLGASGPGYALLGCRWSLPGLLSEAGDRLGAPGWPVVVVPTGCPYAVGLEALLALYSIGLEPVLLDCPERQETRRSCRGEAREAYAAVLEDYERLTGVEALLARGVREALERLSTPPSVKPVAAKTPSTARMAAAQAVKRLSAKTETKALVFGVVTVDAEKCTLCGACAHVCPTRAIVLDRKGGALERLLYSHERCVPCNRCVESCPEDAMSLSVGVDPGLIGVEAVLAEEELFRCIACGKPIGPRRAVEAVVRKLRERGLPEEVVRTAYLCNECKVKYQLGLINPWEPRRQTSGD